MLARSAHLTVGPRGFARLIEPVVREHAEPHLQTDDQFEASQIDPTHR